MKFNESFRWTIKVSLGKIFMIQEELFITTEYVHEAFDL